MADEEDIQLAKIAVKPKTVTHNEPVGWRKGYWWKCTTYRGTFESGAPTREQAIDFAVQTALGHGIRRENITVNGKPV